MSTEEEIVEPYLRGTLVVDGNTNICRGIWAMSVAKLDEPEETDEFELKSISAPEASESNPLSGSYAGHFMMRQPPPYKTLKVEDRDLTLTFTKSGDGSQTVFGEGVNKFGRFKLEGVLSADDVLLMKRTYLPRQPTTKKKAAASVAPDSAPASLGTSEPRSKRARKSSTRASPMKNEDGGDDDDRAVEENDTSDSHGGRPRRQPRAVLKCLEMLREMEKWPNADWFFAPVDYVTLGLLDYPTVIKQPMDFGTIQQQLENGQVTSAASFADLTHLVFRNALIYNKGTGNPVYEAARDLLERFEARYHVMFGNDATEDEEAADGRHPHGSSNDSKGSRGRKSTTVDSPSELDGNGNGSAAASKPGKKRKSTGALVDNIEKTNQQIEEINRSLEALKKESGTGRGSKKSNEPDPNQPLTLEEKQNLIRDVSRLGPQKLLGVLEIIQEVHSCDVSQAKGDELEIPLDELDTSTLRKLQLFIKRRKPGAPTGEKKNVSKTSPPPVPLGIALPAAAHSQYHYPQVSGQNDGMRSGQLMQRRDELPNRNEEEEEQEEETLLSPTSTSSNFINNSSISNNSSERNGAINQRENAVELVNESAWVGRPQSSSDAASSTSLAKPSQGENSMWREALQEFQNKNLRQQELKRSEEEQQKLRMQREKDRLEAVVKQAESIAAASAGGETLAADAQAAGEVARQRELERKQRQDEEQTVHLDHHHELMNILN